MFLPSRPLVCRTTNTLSRAKWPTRLQTTPFRFFSSSRTTRDVRYVRFSPPDRGSGPTGPRKSQHSSNWPWDPRVTAIVAGVGFGTIYYVAHLEQVPQTGRWRFMNTSPKAEAKMGEATREDIYRTMGDKILPSNHPVTRHVRRVVSRILTASGLGTLRGEQQALEVIFGGGSTSDTNFGGAAQPGEAYDPQKEWDVIVVNDKKVVNAMATPGVVVVFTGILPVCQDEEGLAAVVSHEIGHVVARHIAERMSSQTVFLAIIFLLQALNIDYFISSSLTTYLLELPNSRTQESEADLIGLRLMAQACYDPGASPAMFERMAKLENSIMARKGFEFARTHPSSEKRIKHLEKALPEAYDTVSANPECGQVRKQLEDFRETAQGIKVDDFGRVQVV